MIDHYPHLPAIIKEFHPISKQTGVLHLIKLVVYFYPYILSYQVIEKNFTNKNLIVIKQLIRSFCSVNCIYFHVINTAASIYVSVSLGL